MNWTGKNVLVTGASGFIGTHLIRTLLRENAKVFAVDTLPYLSTNKDKVIFEQVDLADNPPSFKDEIKTIFHLAAYAVPKNCEENPGEAFRANVQGTFNILKFATQQNSSKFVFTSSALLYGRNPKYLPINEDHPIEPTENVYCMTKKLGEDLCHSFARKRDLSITILRLFNTFGPGQNGDYIIPTIIYQAMRKKENRALERETYSRS